MSAIPKTSPQTRAGTAKAAKTAKTAKTMSIGVVLERLRTEFPDVTVSKIRFLESEGLITPQRTASGYRRFTDEDVERLRFILITQRDNYLPLKVIREQLEAMDAGSVAPVAAVAEAEPAPTLRSSGPNLFSDVDVATKASAPQEFVDELIRAGLIAPSAAGLFGEDDVRIVTAALTLYGYGLDVRHLKTLRTAASRQADLIHQVTEPLAKSGKASGSQEAEEMAHQMAAVMATLSSSLVQAELRQQRAR